jgi:hypothetical protein
MELPTFAMLRSSGEKLPRCVYQFRHASLVPFVDLGKAYEGEPVNARIARPGIPSMRSASGKSPFSGN